MQKTANATVNAKAKAKAKANANANAGVLRFAQNDNRFGVRAWREYPILCDETTKDGAFGIRQGNSERQKQIPTG